MALKMLLTEEEIKQMEKDLNAFNDLKEDVKAKDVKVKKPKDPKK